MKDLSTRKQAFEQLLALAAARSLNTRKAVHKGPYQIWDPEWAQPLFFTEKISKKELQNRLDRTLLLLSYGDFPSTSKQLNDEKTAIRLVLAAGANPNTGCCKESAFDSFWNNEKRYGALELLKDSRFHYQQNTATVFGALHHHLAFYLHRGRPYLPGTSDEQQAINEQITQDDKEIVKLLFKKRIYPRDQEIFQALAPILQEDDPSFFEQEKQQVITRLQKATTPTQFWAALTGQQKEKE